MTLSVIHINNGEATVITMNHGVDLQFMREAVGINREPDTCIEIIHRRFQWVNKIIIGDGSARLKKLPSWMMISRTGEALHGSLLIAVLEYPGTKQEIIRGMSAEAIAITLGEIKVGEFIPQGW
jgi:hypothetical protein